VPRPPPGSPRLGGRDLSHGRARRIVDRGRDQADGRLSGHRLRTQACRPVALTVFPPRGEHPREGEMRELVVKYLSQGISRRGFVRGLTKAGLTATAAQSVLG